MAADPTEKIEEIKNKIKIEEKKKLKTFSTEDFVEIFTAKAYLDTQTAKLKQAAYDTIPSVIGMLKSKMTVDEILGLDVSEYTSLLKAYATRMGINPQKIDFLEKK